MSRLASLRAPSREEAAPATSDVVAYDTETSDADIWHGQILQFASIRATTDLEPLDVTDFRIRRLPYIVPSPEAMAVTRTDPRTLDDPARPTEFEAAGMIEKALRPIGDGSRIVLTMNGIKFDDGIVRTTLFRNLRDPYVTSGKAVSRVDLLPLMQLVVHGDPSVLRVNRHADGRISWRLEAMADANGIAIAAHDAQGDARATLDMGRLIRSGAPWAWQAAVTNGNSARAGRSLSNAWRERTAVWHFEHFGEPDMAPCAVIGSDDKGKWVLLDLRAGLPPADLDLNDLERRSAAGIRIVRANAMPLLVTHADACRFGPQISSQLADLKATAVLEDGALVARLVGGLRDISYDDEGSSSTTERRIYDGFPSWGDKSKRDLFVRTQGWEERAALRFEDERLNEFASRILAMTAPKDDLFGPDPSSAGGRMIEQARPVMMRPMAGPEAPWMTIDRGRAMGDASWNEWAETVWPDAFYPGRSL